MSEISDAIHNHHREITDTLVRHVGSIVEGLETDPAGFVTFLKEDLLPHAQGEEAYMYPAIDPLVKAYGTATATMSVDHEFIARYIDQIESTVQALRTAPESDRPALRAKLQRTSLQLEALLLVHLEKEERIYMPLFEQHLTEDEQRRILDGMHEAY